MMICDFFKNRKGRTDNMACSSKRNFTWALTPGTIAYFFGLITIDKSYCQKGSHNQFLHHQFLDRPKTKTKKKLKQKINKLQISSCRH